MRVLIAIVALVLFAAACGSDQNAGERAVTPDPTSAEDEPGIADAGADATSVPEPASVLPPPEPYVPGPPAEAELIGPPAVSELFDADGDVLPPRPTVPNGPLAAETIADLDAIVADLREGFDFEAALRLGDSGDIRVAWVFADLLRFFPNDGSIGQAFESLSGVEINSGNAWGEINDLLIAWDIPAPPDYVTWKRVPYEILVPEWKPFFDNSDESDIDYRLLGWGGVGIDDRPVDAIESPCVRGCIPAINDPAVTDAAGGSWYDDDAIVFGVVVNGEARAYPKNIMEIHEMTNDTLGGRRIGMPYCTLCLSAQAYFTDELPADTPLPDGIETVELRTSGLLSRSNKVMFDLHTFSVFDTFTGRALSGPLRSVGLELEQVTVVASTWGQWKQAHPDTTIIAFDGGIGRTYPDDPLRGRDDNGPIFPVGDVDARQPVQAPIIGVIGADGTAVAFPVVDIEAVIARGESPEVNGIRVVPDAGGYRTVTIDTDVEVVSHQAWWFAWSQFHPDTLLWVPAPPG